MKGKVSAAGYVTQAFKELACPRRLADERLAANGVQHDASVSHGVHGDDRVDATGAAVGECVVAEAKTMLLRILGRKVGAW